MSTFRGSVQPRGGGNLTYYILLFLAIITLVACNNGSAPPWLIIIPDDTTYRVEFLPSEQEPYPDGIKFPESILVVESSTINEPTGFDAPDGWTFVGWSSDSSHYTHFDFTLPITQDTKIYAFFVSTNTTPEDESIPKGTNVEYDATQGGYVISDDPDSQETFSGELVIPAYINGIPVTEIDSSTFMRNTSITSVTIPSTVKTVGRSAFNRCSSITSINVDSESISASAFFGTSSVEKIVIGPNVKTIGPMAFKCTNSADSVTLDLPEDGTLTTIDTEAFNGVNIVGELVIPDSVESIRSSAFNNTNITSVKLGSNVKDVSNNAFSNCEQLVSFDYGNSTVTEIKNSCFLGCSALKEIILPETITIIRQNAFDGCVALNEIDIPSSVTQISSSAFKGCTGLTSVNISEDGESLVIQGSYGSYDPSVATNGGGAFMDCTSLEELTIPARVIELGTWTFAGCTKLDVVIESTSIELGDSVFYGWGANEAQTIKFTSYMDPSEENPEEWNENWKSNMSNESNVTISWAGETQ